MDCIVHGVTKSRTQLSAFHFHFSQLRISPLLHLPQVMHHGRSLYSMINSGFHGPLHSVLKHLTFKDPRD